MSAHSVGYLTLLRRNRQFRRLWYGQVVSQLGDWFDSIALYALLPQITGSESSVGLLMLAQFLPSTVVGLWAGVVIDRLPRKAVMIATDLGRALCVLPLLFVQSANQAWLVYLLVALKFVQTSFFDPARGAVLPGITTRDELVAANAIVGATWSAMLAIGAALGGIVAGTLGIQAAFIIDALTFVLSAVLIATVQIPERHLNRSRVTSGWQDLREGLSYLMGQRDIAVYAMTKALWSIGGGVLVLLTIFGRRVFPIGVNGATSIGLLYAARGLGAGIGPMLAQRLGGDSVQFMRRAIGLSFLVSALGYTAFAGMPMLPLAMIAVVFAHMGGSTEWVFSTTLLQMSVPNRLLGRVFAVEYAAIGIINGVASYGVSVLADAGWQPRALALLVAAAFVPPGLAVMAWLWGPPSSGEVAPAHDDESAALHGQT